MAESPFAGLRIVVTRPREQAVGLQQQIEQLGGKVVLFPLLEIGPPRDVEAMRVQVSRLAAFDLAIFISPNAVRYGSAAIQQVGGWPSGLRVAAVGAGSATALHQSGVAEVVAPSERFDSEALLELPALRQVAGQKIAIFRGDGGRELLGDTLRQRGASVEYIACYQRSKPQQDKATLFAGDSVPDAITISSSEALANLWHMLQTQEQRRLIPLPLFVPHSRIAEAAAQLGWQQVILTPSGDDGVVSALLVWAKNKNIQYNH